MKIIRPHGESRTFKRETFEGEVPHLSRRILTLNKESNKTEDHHVPEFAKSHKALVLAQWVSAIDKIIRKTGGRKKPGKLQRELRQKIGEAAWKVIAKEGVLPEEDREKFFARVHPYMDGDANAEPDSEELKGKWYRTFLGESDPETAHVGGIGKKIFDHLYTKERQINLTARDSRARPGLIEHRATSIDRNVLKAASKGRNVPWSSDDEERYFQHGNLPAKIHELVAELEKENQSPVRMSDLGPLFYDHYASVFVEDGQVVLIREVIAAHQEKHGKHAGEPPMLALHTAVKEWYVRRLRGHKARKHKNLNASLPTSPEALLELIKKQYGNADTTALIRIGKIQHYELMRRVDETGARSSIVSDWSEVSSETSPYWTSVGQAEIKRNEAFVRRWRAVLGFAHQTLTDWIDPEGHEDRDILLEARGAEAIERAEEGFLDDKARLLFGTGAEAFTSLGLEGKKASVTALWQALMDLRNTSFHFKGYDSFIAALERLSQIELPDALGAVWTRDGDRFADRIADTVRGAGGADYLLHPDLNRYLGLLLEGDPHLMPLPRFRRMLVRAGIDGVLTGRARLPAPHNRQIMEEYGSLRCQYILLKLLYERVFASWLQERDAEELRSWIDNAVVRSTAAAKALNQDPTAVARAAREQTISDTDTVATFLDRLSSAMASEVRVQKGYSPDKEAAKRKSKFLDDLGCDVLAQAFAKMIEDQELLFLTRLKEQSPKLEQKAWSPDVPQVKGPPAPWQQTLYALVHLVPVGDIAALRHQIAKWMILRDKIPDIRETGDEVLLDADDTRAKRVAFVFDLYLSMHDEKFDGSTAISLNSEFSELFKPVSAGKRLFPEAPNASDDLRLPVRGLREMVRFGGLKALWPVFTEHPVTDGIVSKVLTAENDVSGQSFVVEAQKLREKLHDEWRDLKPEKAWERKPDLPADKLALYWEALSTVTAHRSSAAHCRLTNHVKLYRLAMNVLGRMVDYAGLWERDLYFVLLGIMVEQQKSPASVLKERGVKMLEQGRIVPAVEAIKCVEVKTRMQEIFGSDYLGKENSPKNTRNKLAHFGVLRSKSQDGGPNGLARTFTGLVNETRRMMRYDRKLKNAVSGSIKELLMREKLELIWEMNDHQLCDAKVRTGRAEHMNSRFIYECMHGPEMIEMVAKLFNGSAVASKDVTTSKFEDGYAAHMERMNKRKNKTRKKSGDRERAVATH